MDIMLAARSILVPRKVSDHRLSSRNQFSELSTSDKGGTRAASGQQRTYWSALRRAPWARNRSFGGHRIWRSLQPGRLTGRVDVEDLLDVIFADFCIGK